MSKRVVSAIYVILAFAIAGVSTATYITVFPGDLTITGDTELNGDITLENDETIKNDNNGEIELGNGTEDTAFSFGSNTCVLSSDTGVVEFDLGAVGTTLKFANDQTIVSDTDNEIQLGDGSEDISFGFATADTVVVTSDTAVSTLDLGEVGTTITLDNDQTIVSDTDNEIQIGDNSEDISFGFGTANECTISTDTGVTRVDFADIGVKTSVPTFLVKSVRFCGNGMAGSTAHYIGPEPWDGGGLEYATGGAGCDALDNATEATVDAPLPESPVTTAIEVTAMYCSGICTGASAANDTVTFQMREDVADVTGMTCNFAFGGDATANQCSVVLDAPVTVAAASALAVKITGTDDACSDAGDDFECVVSYHYP